MNPTATATGWPQGRRIHPTAPRAEGISAWDELSDEEQELYARFMETYAGFLTHTDEQIGKLMDSLEEMGELDNTLIMLMSDNGASYSVGEQGTMNHAMAYI